MIFSAVALVAFSFAGMANEVEEKYETESRIENDPKDCNSTRVILYLSYMAAGFSHAEASAEAYSYYFGCLRNKGLSIE